MTSDNATNCTTFDEYQRLALRTLNHKGHVENLLHAIMGMCGEAGEYSEIPELDKRRIGELGDCLWYCAVLSNELGYSLTSFTNTARSTNDQSVEFGVLKPGLRAMLWGCRLIDSIKKTVFYGKSEDTLTLVHGLKCYLEALFCMAKENNMLLIDVGAINIRKLAARYPNKIFDADKAINRDYEVESQAAGVKIV